jgi:DNA helicase-2/ATP-dependent DNA helicase PcrA
MYLVGEKDIDPSLITVITFTKEAAENMRRRIADQEKETFVIPEKRPRITTMHSLGLGIIQAHREILGLPEGFQVMSNIELRKLIFRDAAILSGFGESDAKDAERARSQSLSLDPDTPVAKIIGKYESILRANKAIDYDDQISLACRILSKDEQVRSQYCTAASHLLIDEYQDINAAQRRLIELLSQQHPEGLFVVGDDDQSIYSFRGGTPRYIRDFHREYSIKTPPLCMVQSRRCPDIVIRAALDVVRKFDPLRVKKPDPTFSQEKQNGSKVKIHNVASDAHEAKIVASIVKNALPNKTALVLIPTRQYAENIKRGLRRRRISYDHPLSVGNSGFALLQTLYRWLQDPEDNFSLRLCIESLCNSGIIYAKVKKKRTQKSKISRQEQFAGIGSLWQEVVPDERSLWRVLEARAKVQGGMFSALHEQLKALSKIDHKDVPEFIARAVELFRPWRNLDELMKEIGMWIEEVSVHSQNTEDRVRIMTLQGAKGLQADVVCVVGLNNGVIPRLDASEEEIQEWARLVYVSMTRAVKELHLFYARKRDTSVTFIKLPHPHKQSRFLDSINQECREDCYHQAPNKNIKTKKIKN